MARTTRLAGDHRIMERQLYSDVGFTKIFNIISMSRVPAKETSKMDVCDVFNKLYRGKEGSSFLPLGLENH